MHRIFSLQERLGSFFGLLLSGPQALAFLPAAILAGYWLGGEATLIALAIGLPVCLALTRQTAPWRRPLLSRTAQAGALHKRLTSHLAKARRKSLQTGCFHVQIDDFGALMDRYGEATSRHVTALCRDSLRSLLRGKDAVVNLGDGQLAVVLRPVSTLETETGIQISQRLQEALEAPIVIGSTTIHLSASVGFALAAQVDDVTPVRLAEAAEIALRDAMRCAPSAIRAYQPGMSAPFIGAQGISGEAAKALVTGQILPWFQPQISAHTGQITGFEALARWIHPEHGAIAPSEFLPALEQAGKMDDLGEVILARALGAMRDWDRAGLDIPRVGVNFSPEELRNPKLVDRLKWTLDRFDFSPDRLLVEIVETVVATSPDDTAVRNINGLAALGCRIDLDDFGTGHASISSLRRFAVNRLKIDRSFVTKVDRDGEQQRMISAIVLMAEQLNLDTLAEGVETAEEHAMLAQLGCNHVQGFGICRPIPFEQTIEWARAHGQTRGVPPVAGRKTG